MNETSRRFIQVLVTREKLKLAREEVALAEKILDVANKRFRAGDVTEIDVTRSEALLEAIRINLEKTRFTLASNRQALAAMWGSTHPNFERVVGNLYKIGPVPRWEFLASWISRNPDVARWITEMAKRKADLRLAKAKRIPDVEFGFGLRTLNRPDEETETGATVPVPNDTALVAELKLPIPIFDRNQGNIGAARSALAKGAHQSRAALVKVQTTLVKSYNALLAARTEAESMRSKVLPALQSAFEGIRLTYRMGRIGYLDLLEAQKSLIRQQHRYIVSLGDYHDSLADLEALIGQPLGSIR
jgi:cobalt-zinc-cadmium efflux system outer membrane protein